MKTQNNKKQNNNSIIQSDDIECKNNKLIHLFAVCHNKKYSRNKKIKSRYISCRVENTSNYQINKCDFVISTSNELSDINDHDENLSYVSSPNINNYKSIDVLYIKTINPKETYTFEFDISHIDEKYFKDGEPAIIFSLMINIESLPQLINLSKQIKSKIAFNYCCEDVHHQ